tara:strand:+ start:332 stop:847 length:516 start_codon:yes stop_codon:yes gene_type:complete
MTREIGRVIVRFAYADHYSQGIIYMLVNVSRAIGRLAVREARLEERFELIQDLAGVRGFPIGSVDIKEMSKRIQRIAKNRNLYAHGSWAYSDSLSCWAVMVTTGKWTQQDERHDVKGRKKIQPEGQVVELSDIRAVTSEIDAFIKDLRVLQRELEDQERGRIEVINQAKPE